MATTGPAFSGAVLTGGRSTRMGRDKALVPVDGEPMAARVAGALRAAGAAEVLAIGGDLGALDGLGFDGVLADRHPGEGPLGGLLTALEGATHEIVVVVACDLPATTPAAISEVLRSLGDHDVAMPVTDRREPLHAAWRTSACLPVLASAFEAGERAVHRAVASLDVAEVTLRDPAALHNVNRPADLPG